MTDKEIIGVLLRKRKEERCRLVVRPRFTLYRELFGIIAAAAVLTAIICFSSLLPDKLFVPAVLVASVLFIVTQAKSILLIMIFTYQKFAPKLIRSACLFTPSCSEYMRISIQKYGVLCGVGKGLRRLRRCHPPNGGFDEP